MGNFAYWEFYISYGYGPSDMRYIMTSMAQAAYLPLQIRFFYLVGNRSKLLVSFAIATFLFNIWGVVVWADFHTPSAAINPLFWHFRRLGLSTLRAAFSLALDFALGFESCFFLWGSWPDFALLIGIPPIGSTGRSSNSAGWFIL